MSLVFVKLARFSRYPGFVKGWFIPVWLLLGLARLAILTVSFRRLAPRLGHSVGIAPWLPLLTEREAKKARLTSQVIRLAARYTPWESNCFPQAITARIMLGIHHVPYCAFFGLRRNANTGAFDAHAWVAAGRVRVIGETSFHLYTVVGVFASPRLMKNYMAETTQRESAQKHTLTQ